MYGFLFRPKWIAFHVLVFGSVALMVWLGFWQLRRLEDRKDFNEVVATHVDQDPVPLEDLLAEAGDDIDSVEWRQVTVGGSWLPDQVIWYNRSQNGAAGDNVLTALVGADGTTVVVNRGFVAIAEEVPDAPAGDVQVLGRIRVPLVRSTDTGDEYDDVVTEMRRVDLGRLEAQLPGDVAPVYLDLVATVPPVADTGPFPTPVPVLDEGSHLSYAMQWFIFAACVVIGWVLAIRRSITTRRVQRTGRPADDGVTGGSGSQTQRDSQPSAADEASTAPT